MSVVRQAAVAGTFYPADPEELRAAVERFLGNAEEGPYPPAVIVPHAGYMYSGPVAASVYARLKRAARTIRRVVLVGPAHYEPVSGIAIPSAGRFATPLGEVVVDDAAIEELRPLPQVNVMDAAHLAEHCLEVQLPFLQVVLTSFTLVPLLVGDATPEEVGEVLELVWGGAETLVVVSSDLSHYHDYDTARDLDHETAHAIEELRPEDLHSQQACGCNAIQGLLHVARSRGLHARLVDLRNSGDTAGPRDRVVGYGAFVFE